MSVSGLVRFAAGVVAASLVGVAIYGVLLIQTPLSDWMGYLSIPIERCGFDLPPSPIEYPCIARLYVGLSEQIIGVALVIWGLIYWKFFSARPTRWQTLLLVGGGAAALMGCTLKIAEVVILLSGVSPNLLKNPGFERHVVVPQLAASVVWAIVGSAFGILIAGASRLAIDFGSARDERQIAADRGAS